MPLTNPKQPRRPAPVKMLDGSEILCRRRSIHTLASAGVLPIQLSVAMDQFAAKHEGMSDEKIAAAIADDEAAEMATIMRRFVCAVAIEPQVVMQDGDDDALLPPGSVSINDLEPQDYVAIWRACHAPAPLDTPVVPPQLPDLSTEVARAEFRGERPPDAAGDVPAGTSVRPASEQLADNGMA